MTQLKANMPVDQASAMPDIAIETQPQLGGKIDWVGMSRIDLPLDLNIDSAGPVSVNAKVQAYVSLDDPEAKGIHMSRLYLAIDQQLANKCLSTQTLNAVLDEFLSSHAGLSESGLVELSFDAPLRRKALISDNSGFKAYPCTVRATRNAGQTKIELELEIAYSSTCPCSAALARQLIQQGFEQKFGGTGPLDSQAVYDWLGTVDGIRATPHSQRSVAQLKLTLTDDYSGDLPIVAVIDVVEERLGTPVQTAVKRVDEQEFARLNGQNLMFCEDAVRRIHQVLDVMPTLSDFWIRVNHYESLHAHDAVAVSTKGIEHGYRKTPGASSTL